METAPIDPAPIDPAPIDPIELHVDGVVAGGAGIARDSGGRVIFVTGAIPGERVRAVVTREKSSHAFANTVEIIDPSPDRVEAPCPYVAVGCGGCSWQHITSERQRALLGSIVADALLRIGRFPSSEIEAILEPTVPLPTERFRTSVRAAVTNDRAALRIGDSHDLVRIETCLVAHPLVDEILRVGRFPGAREVTIRVGAATGERMVIADRAATGFDLPDDVIVADRRSRDIHIHEVVAGARFRISAPSFFQTRADGADALVALVREAVGWGARLVDLYSGVGLFAAALAAQFDEVLAVESKLSAVADARHNLEPIRATVYKCAVEDWAPVVCDTVVADPSREGLRKPGVATIVGCEPRTVVLVSCDAAAFARDAWLLADRGYTLLRVMPIDLFPHTAHVEVVGQFERADS